MLKNRKSLVFICFILLAMLLVSPATLSASHDDELLPMYHSYGKTNDACPTPARFTGGTAVFSTIGFYATQDIDLFFWWFSVDDNGNYLNDISTFQHTYRSGDLIGAWNQFSVWDTGNVILAIYIWDGVEWSPLSLGGYQVGVDSSRAPQPGPCPGSEAQAPQNNTPPEPTRPSSPFNIQIGGNHVYEDWGRPDNNQPCGPNFNDNSPARRFTVQTLFTNNSGQHVSGVDWLRMRFNTNSGRETYPACYWGHNPQEISIAPGQVGDITFFTHLERGDWITSITYTALGYTTNICLNQDGSQRQC